MRKTILLVLALVVIATPCFAQEVEPDGIFSIEGTSWESLLGTLMIFPFPWLELSGWYNVGFYDNGVYPFAYPDPSENAFYVDTPALSIYMDYRESRGYNTSYRAIYFGILQPIGIGVVTIYMTNSLLPIPSIYIMILIKADDNWSPPEEE